MADTATNGGRSEARKLGVLEERTDSAHARIGDIEDDLRRSFEKLEQGIEKINDKLDNHYVSKSEFHPVRTVVYGMVGIVLMAVLTAIVAGVFTVATP